MGWKMWKLAWGLVECGLDVVQWYCNLNQNLNRYNEHGSNLVSLVICQSIYPPNLPIYLNLPWTFTSHGYPSAAQLPSGIFQADQNGKRCHLAGHGAFHCYSTNCNSDSSPGAWHRITKCGSCYRSGSWTVVVVMLLWLWWMNRLTMLTWSLVKPSVVVGAGCWNWRRFIEQPSGCFVKNGASPGKSLEWNQISSFAILESLKQPLSERNLVEFTAQSQSLLQLMAWVCAKTLGNFKKHICSGLWKLFRQHGDCLDQTRWRLPWRPAECWSPKQELPCIWSCTCLQWRLSLWLLISPHFEIRIFVHQFGVMHEFLYRIWKSESVMIYDI